MLYYCVPSSSPFKPEATVKCRGVQLDGVLVVELRCWGGGGGVTCAPHRSSSDVFCTTAAELSVLEVCRCRGHFVLLLHVQQTVSRCFWAHTNHHLDGVGWCVVLHPVVERVDLHPFLVVSLQLLGRFQGLAARPRIRWLPYLFRAVCANHSKTSQMCSFFGRCQG